MQYLYGKDIRFISSGSPRAGNPAFNPLLNFTGCANGKQNSRMIRGVARIFQRGEGGSQRLLTRSPSGDRRLFLVYTAAFPPVSAGSVVLSRHEGLY